MRSALISDVHANEQALLATLEDISTQGVEQIFCLGDFIGYGPKPVECAELIMKHATRTILGNHDQAALFDPDNFNPQALLSVYWTRRQLEESKNGEAIFEFLGGLPTHHREGEILLVHGSPHGPTEEYLFPDDVWDYSSRLARSFALLREQRFALCGHTHIPGIFKETDSAEFSFTPQSEFGDEWITLTDLPKAIINVGSVGQPRDNNRDSCYVLLEQDGASYRMQFRRVWYDAEATAKLIFDNPDIPDRLGERLLSGR